VQAGTVPPSARDEANNRAQQAPPQREQRAPAPQREQRAQGAQREPRVQREPRAQAESRAQRAPRPETRSAARGQSRADAPRSTWRSSGSDNRSDNRQVQQRQWRTPTDPRDRNHRPNPPRRYVPALPGGYARHHWQGRPYYYHSGRWYRPWGSQFAIVRPPIGLSISYLPSYHTSFWYGGSNYYFADDTYYLYEPSRRTYVVARSPYGDDADEYEEAFDEDEMFVYPARGQSEEQQADDRYECHRWAVDQTNYNPVEGDYDVDDREDYMRALGACLTGRGYTVK
jgi:hypothetical protein